MDGNIEKMQSLTGRIKGLGIDKTLTKKGMCAEAEATGKALATKVSITDIVDDLLSVADNKPLSANQGRVLKKQIDEIDPHYAENVLYNDTNVKDALDKVSKAENIVYEGDKSVQGAIDELKGTIGYTKKQLIPYPYYHTTRTASGMTFTDNGDGTVKVNGNASADVGHNIKHRTESDFILKKGTYILNGCPSGGSESTFKLTVAKTVNGSGVYIAEDFGEGVIFTLTEDTELGVYINVMNGATVNDTFKPMIRYASIEDDAFESYVASVSDMFKRKSYELTLATNNNVSPFTMHGQVDISKDIALYGHPICYEACDINSAPLPAAYVGSKGQIRVSGNIATVFVGVTYSKILPTVVS